MRSLPTTSSTFRFFLLITSLLIGFIAASQGCSQPESSTASGKATDASPGTLSLVATTGQINSALQELTEGTGATVKLFCGPGVDPHSFSASTRDIQAMQNCDAIIYNGFHLEARLDEHLHLTFGDKAWAMASAFPEQDRLDWMEDGETDPNAPFDPHIWNHLPGWSKCVDGLANYLMEIDPDNRETYQKNLDSYSKKIDIAHQWAIEQLSAIPQSRRYIVSAHDAFNYFARVYDMQTLAPLGVGNDAEADIQTMSSVAAEICEKKVPAIFLEAITNPKVSKALQEACQSRGWEVKIVSQQLYSDDLGETAPQNTFLGAFRSNVEIIVENLK
jgi:manganese/zinc/iron transport system substrate-binding protein